MSNGFESFVTLAVEVEIDVADFVYIPLCPGVRAVLNRIHSHEHVVAAGTLIGKPSLEAGARYGLSLGYCLNGVAGGAAPHKDRCVVRGFEKLPDILRRGERSRRECGVCAHVCSCCAKNTAP